MGLKHGIRDHGGAFSPELGGTEGGCLAWSSNLLPELKTDINFKPLTGHALAQTIAIVRYCGAIVRYSLPTFRYP